MIKVKIYSTPYCVYCKLAKEFFKEQGIDHEEVNVAADEKEREEMVKKSHQMGVPVIDINGEIFVGFNKKEIKKALGI